MIGTDIFLRITDSKTGSSVVRHHRVWDADRFIESRREEHRKEGEKEGDPTRYVVSLSSRDEYRAANAKEAA